MGRQSSSKRKPYSFLAGIARKVKKCKVIANRSFTFELQARARGRVSSSEQGGESTFVVTPGLH